MPQNRKKYVDITSHKNLVTVVVVFLVIALLTMTISAYNINAEKVAKEEQKKAAQALNPVAQKTFDGKELPKEYKTENVDKTQINTGELILVNNSNKCQIDGNNLVSLYENFNNTYTVSDKQVKINFSAVDAINHMFTGFYDAYGETGITVACGYRDKDVQNSLYQKEQENKSSDADSWVAKPGFSEHQTGYAFDLTIIENGATYDYDGTGNYKWINNNSYKYGIVVRYPLDKTQYTAINNEPWHFRYVGKPHAYYIYKNNLCLEEYIDILHKHKIDDPLMFTDDNNKSYMVYYVPCSGFTTDVQVPQDFIYSISGDNQSGVFVTVEL